MDRWVFSFITACLVSLFWATLPSHIVLAIILILAVFVLRFSYGVYLSGFLSGCLWMASVGHWMLYWQLPLSHISSIERITGEVVSLIAEQENVTFSVRVSSANEGEMNYSSFAAPVVRLNWREPGWALKQGQKVSLGVRLKPLNGLANQGAFHYQQWLRSQNISAKGYVLHGKDTEHLLLDSRVSLRQLLSDKLSTLDVAHGSWVAALTLGDRSGFSHLDWALVQKTGVAHLIAISGLHLVSIAALVMLLLRFVLTLAASKIRFAQRINLLTPITLLTLSICLGYAGLAGMGTPVVRAWLMLLFFAIATVWRRYWRGNTLLMYCLFSFILLFPEGLFSASFWLSFGAVACIAFLIWRWPEQSQGKNQDRAAGWGMLSLLRLQVLLSVLMAPIVAQHFSQVSLVSPFVNLIAVPYVTLVLVPLCLFALLALATGPEYLVGWLFSAIDWLIELGLGALRLASQTQLATLSMPDIPILAWLSGLIGGVLILVPSHLRMKVAGVLFCLPLLSFIPFSQNPGWQIDVLDVGQGLSVLITRNHRGILYDTGPAYEGGMNSADSVILPVMKAKRLRSLDIVVISHFDNDHAGSLSALQASIDVTQVISNRDRCHSGWQRDWQGLTLKSLWPQKASPHSGNHASCVLLVTDGIHRVLLTGDVDRSAEYRLVEEYGEQLKADLLMAPHHGSMTSSSERFIQAVDPDYVVFTVGFMNRWNFPRQQVVNRYYAAGVRMLSTADSGQITFEFASEPNDPINVIRYRQDRRNYWYANL